MTQIMSVLAVVGLAVLLMPLAVRSMRRRRRGGGGLGGAFLSLEAMVRPAAEHVIEARQEQPKGSPENGEPPTER
ncbi:hypothetical protein MMB232_00824 [Brevundimonas subvibrioides]|uniref:hypothetical protein n=1 Tax=Brevundimonas subvibrioides TaxID=74313 RepID=UPI0032D5A306